MDCTKANDLLSAYYDGELPSEIRATVAEHLSNCSDCTRELERFGSLSAMSRDLLHPELSSDIWNQIEQQLEEDDITASEAAQHTRTWSRPMFRVMALAATVLIAVGIGWFALESWTGHGGHAPLAAEFTRYLDEFRRDPIAAQRILLEMYEGQPVDADQAVTRVGFRPAIADGLPEGYTVESTYVIKMPCCTCVKCLCKRSDGSTIAIFEHDDKEPEWFDERSAKTANCNGKPCSMVGIDDRFAANWRRGERHMTVIGVRDEEEVSSLVAWFDDRKRIRPE